MCIYIYIHTHVHIHFHIHTCVHIYMFRYLVKLQPHLAATSPEWWWVDKLSRCDSRLVHHYYYYWYITITMDILLLLLLVNYRISPLLSILLVKFATNFEFRKKHIQMRLQYKYHITIYRRNDADSYQFFACPHGELILQRIIYLHIYIYTYIYMYIYIHIYIYTYTCIRIYLSYLILSYLILSIVPVKQSGRSRNFSGRQVPHGGGRGTGNERWGALGDVEMGILDLSKRGS